LKRFILRSPQKPASASEAAPESLTLPAPQPPGQGWLRGFVALRQRNYRLYWFGQMISVLGTSMQTIGQAWLVLELTHSPWQLGLVGALEAVPILLFSLVGGVFADRWPKRRVLLVTQSTAMLQAFFLWLLLVSHSLQLWHLYVLALLLGLTSSLGRPASRAFLVEMVGREDLPNAVAMSFAISNLASIIGPGLGGIIIAASGVTLLFLLNALSFLAVIGALALIKQSELHAQAFQQPNALARQTTWQRLREGLAYVRRTSAISLLIVVVGLVLLFGSNFNVVLPLFATAVLGVGATGYGFLSAAVGVGALLATLWLAWRNRRPTLRPVLVGMLVYALLEAAFAVSRSYPLSLLLIASVGFLETAFATQSMTILQTVIPDHLRGRVMSVQVLFFDGSLPLGYLLLGSLSGALGPVRALLIAAFLTLLTAGAGWLGRTSAEQELAASRAGG
jgi:MFS family permease